MKKLLEKNKKLFDLCIALLEKYEASERQVIWDSTVDFSDLEKEIKSIKDRLEMLLHE